MISPKEKAVELFDSMSGIGDENHHCTTYVAKQCALIAQKNLLEKLQSLNITDEFEENVLLEIMCFNK